MKEQLNATDLYYLISFDVFRATEAGFILYAVNSLDGQRDKTNIQFHTNAPIIGATMERKEA